MFFSLLLLSETSIPGILNLSTIETLDQIILSWRVGERSILSQPGLSDRNIIKVTNASYKCNFKYPRSYI